MKQIVKRLGSALLALALLIALVPATAIPARAEETEDSEGIILDGVKYCLAYFGEDRMLITGYTDDIPENLVIPEEINGYPVTSFENAMRGGFQNCTALKSVEFPSQFELIDWTLPYAFEGCCNLTEFRVAEDHEYVCAIDGVLYGKDENELVLCPPGRSGRFVIPEGTEIISDGAFSGCGKLTDIQIPESIREISDGAFRECTGLKRMYIPGGEGTYLGGSSYAVGPCPVFYGCTGLEEVSIAGGVFCYEENFNGCSSLKTIRIGAGTAFFSMGVLIDCENMQNLYLPDTITEIKAAYDSYNDKLIPIHLTDIFYTGSEEQWNAIDIMDGAIPENTVIHFNYTDPVDPTDPTEPVENPFTDVKETDYYYEPVLWAVENGITSGVSADKFGPSAPCTRAQIMTFLWRAAGSPAPKSDQNPFSDVKSSDYYCNAVLWAVENGITSGVSATQFGPNSPCTRAQAATFLWHAVDSPAPKSDQNPFTDVKPGDYYHNAVLWAVENGITSGVSADKFGPNQTCTRGQIVTFLYKAFHE